MQHARRTAYLVGGIALSWAVLWPAIGLGVVAVLTVILGPGGDVGPVEIVAILGPLGLWAGIMFGVIAVSLGDHARGIDVPLALAIGIGCIAAVSLGIVAGLRPNATMNSLVLGAISGPASVAIVRRIDRRERLRA